MPFSTETYYYLVLGLSCLAYLVNTYVDLRQHRAIVSATKPPKVFTSSSSQTEFVKARLYALDRSFFALAVGLFTQIQSTFMLICGLLPKTWQWSQTVLPGSWNNEIWTSLVFTAIITIVGTIIDLPFSLYSTFCIEKKHGFNKQTPLLFLSDKLKGLVLTFAIGGPVIAALIWTIQKTGSYFFVAAWILLMLVQLIVILIYPTFIMPLFNKFQPLEKGELRTKIEALSMRLKFPLRNIYLMDGSKRSSHSNAFFFGLFKNKRIVIYDTLVDQASTAEIVAILGHELGHWALSHMPRRLIAAQVHLLAMFYLFGFFMREKAFYYSFGFTQTQPIIVGLLLFQYIFTPVEMFAGFLMSWQSRQHEFEADAFAHSLGHNADLQSGLLKIHIENKSMIEPDWLYSTLHHSHPPCSERIAALTKLNSAQKKKL